MKGAGGDQVHGAEVVHGQAELSRRVAEAAAEREPGEAGGRDEAAGGGEAVGLGLLVEIPDQHARVGARAPALGVHVPRAHRGQVQHQAALARGVPGDVVAASADGDLEPVLAGERDRRHHLGRARGPRDERGTAVDHRVPDGACLVVALVPGREHLSADALAKRGDVLVTQTLRVWIVVHRTHLSRLLRSCVVRTHTIAPMHSIAPTLRDPAAPSTTKSVP